MVRPAAPLCAAATPALPPRRLSGATTAPACPARAGAPRPLTPPCDPPRALQELGPDAHALAEESLARQLGIGGGHFAMVTDEGSLYTWGDAGDGQLGLAFAAEHVDAPEFVDRLVDNVVVAAACGAAHTVCVDSNGAVYSWGRDDIGQCGHGYKAPKARELDRAAGVNFAPRNLRYFFNTRVARVACGATFSMAISDAGALYSWGDGGCGQLGTGRVTKRDRPEEVDVGGHPVSDVACGWGHCIALSARDGDVYVWGFNSKGQLGLGDCRSRHTPTRLAKQDLRRNKDYREHVKAQRALMKQTLARTGSIEALPPHLREVADVEFSDDEDERKEEEAKREAIEAELKKVGSKAALIMKSAVDSLDSKFAGAPIVTPYKVPEWGPPEDEVRAIGVAAGEFHSCFIAPDGALFVWGATADHRTGLPESEYYVDVENGDVTEQQLMNICYPMQLGSIAHRRVVAVDASRDHMIAVCKLTVDGIKPPNGYASGGTRLSLHGGGLEGLAAIGGTRGAAGSVIPGVEVVFTRAAQEVPAEERSADDEEGEEESVDSEYERSFQELVLKVPALCPMEDADLSVADIQCVSPGFPSPCDVTVHVEVYGVRLDGDMAYSFYNPPEVTKVSPPMTALPGDDVTFRIEGNGLFGCAIADPVVKETAESFVLGIQGRLAGGEDLFLPVKQARAKLADAQKALNKLRNKKKAPSTEVLQAAEQAVADAQAAIEKAQRGPTEMAPRVKAHGGAGHDSGSDGKLGDDEDTGESKLTVKFTALCDGEPLSDPVEVPGTYEVRYAEMTEEMKKVAMEEAGIDSEDEGDDAVDEPGMFVADVHAPMPRFDLLAEVYARQDEGHRAELAVLAEIAVNGTDYIPGKSIVAYAPRLDDTVTPDTAPTSGGTLITLTGKGIVDAPHLSVVFTAAGDGSQKWRVPANFVSPWELTVTVPPLTLPVLVVEEEEEGSADGAGEAKNGGGDGSADDDEEKDGGAAEDDAPPDDDGEGDAEEPEPEPEPVCGTNGLGAPGEPPTIGSGMYSLALSVEDGGQEYASQAPFRGYAGSWAGVDVDLVPEKSEAGATALLYPPREDRRFLFDSEHIRVRVRGEKFDAVVTGVHDYERNGISFELPPWDPDLTPPPEEKGDDDESDGEGDAKDAAADEDDGKDEDEEGKGGAEGGADGGDGDGDAGEEEEVDEEERLALHDLARRGIDRHVSLSVTLNGVDWMETGAGYQYYNLRSVGVLSVEPCKKVKAGTEVTVTGVGWAPLIELQRPLLLRFASADFEELVTASVPTVAEKADEEEDGEADPDAADEEHFEVVVEVPEAPKGKGAHTVVEVSVDGTHFTKDAVELDIK